MNKELKKEFDNLAYRYAHSGEPDHKLLWDFIEKALQAKEEEVVERVEIELEKYFCGKHKKLFKLLASLK